MVSITSLILTVVAFAGAASAASLHTRSSKLTFTVVNNCKHDFAPIFVPSLPGKDSWPVILSGKSEMHEFTSDTYAGKVFSPLRRANTTTGEGATQGEVDLASGNYDISVADGFNVAMYLNLLGQQRNGQCQPAHCMDASCHDAYKSQSGTLTATRVGEATDKPNHNCSPAFTQWLVQFC